MLGQRDLENLEKKANREKTNVLIFFGLEWSLYLSYKNTPDNTTTLGTQKYTVHTLQHFEQDNKLSTLCKIGNTAIHSTHSATLGTQHYIIHSLQQGTFAEN